MCSQIYIKESIYYSEDHMSPASPEHGVDRCLSILYTDSSSSVPKSSSVQSKPTRNRGPHVSCVARTRGRSLSLDTVQTVDNNFSMYELKLYAPLMEYKFSAKGHTQIPSSCPLKVGWYYFFQQFIKYANNQLFQILFRT